MLDKLLVPISNEYGMASIQASQQGLVQIKQAIASKGWKVSSDRWLLEASKLLEPQGTWDELGPYAYGCSRQTWERFLQGKAIRDRSFQAFCEVLQIESHDVTQKVNRLREDWGDAPDVPIFYGRKQEVATLEQWILKDNCRVITIIGLAGIGKTRLVRGGIGKTDLSLHLARQIQGEFEYLIWRRLINAPPPEILITELIELVSEHKETQFAKSLDGLVSQLLKYLKQRRCLLIFDNVESILHHEDTTRNYPSNYEGYDILLRCIGETKHQSCLVLTSRLKPQVIEEMEGLYPVRSLELKGLDLNAGRAIFQHISQAYNVNFQGSDRDWSNLVSFYHGNPLALEVTARHILRRFNGNLREFLQQDLRVFGKIRELLDWHFERLSEAGKTIMYWLAINRESVLISDLKEDILSFPDKKYLPEILDTLERKIPIEKSCDGYTLQPVLIEYMTERAIEQICQELSSNQFQLINTHALIKASAKDYVRDSQVRLILQPIIEQLVSVVGLETGNSLEKLILQLLSTLKQTHRQLPGYAAGNLLNLMRYANLDLRSYDFSQMIIWQAHLQGANLHNVNFTGCKFAKCSFNQDFANVFTLAFSPNQDLFAIGDSMGNIQLFRVRDRQIYLAINGHEHSYWVTSLAFSPDGKLLASSSMDSTIRLWNVKTGECLKTFTGEQKWIWTVAFSPDGQTIASGGDDHKIWLWHIHTGKCQVLVGHNAWVKSVTFHPHGNLLASGARDRTVRLWDTATGECCQILKGHQNGIFSVNFGLNGAILASGSLDNTIKLWDVNTGKCLRSLTGHSQEVYSISFSADGKNLVSGSFDHTIKLWDTTTGECCKTLKGHNTGVCVVDIASNQDLIVSADYSNQTMKLWDFNTGECLKTWQGHINSISALAISPDGKFLASSGADKVVRLWNLEREEEITILIGHNYWVWSTAFAPNGKILASSSDDQTIKLWDIETGKCLNTLEGHKDRVWPVAFSLDGQLLASASIDGTICFWDVASGKNLWHISAHSNWIWTLTFSPNGQILASGSDDKTIKLWDVKTRECCMSITDPSSTILSVAFHPHSRSLISGGNDGQIKLWDLATGQLKHTFSGHTESIHDLLFGWDGRTIISCSTDETIRFWDIDTRQCIRVLQGHHSAIKEIVLTPDQQKLISCSADGTIRIWDVETGKTLKILRPKRPYEGMNISNVSGITLAQKNAAITLGAYELSHWSQVKLVSKLSRGFWEEIERKTGQNLAVCLEREQHGWLKH